MRPTDGKVSASTKGTKFWAGDYENCPIVHVDLIEIRRTKCTSEINFNNHKRRCIKDGSHPRFLNSFLGIVCISLSAADYCSFL